MRISQLLQNDAPIRTSKKLASEYGKEKAHDMRISNEPTKINFRTEINFRTKDWANVRRECQSVS